MIRNVLLFVVCALICTAQMAIAQNDGYTIKVKVTDASYQDSMIYLAHYYGKPLPTIYKTDSAKFDKNNVATLQSKEKITGGIYLIVFPGRSSYFDFLLDNGDKMEITAATKKLPTGITFKGSPENERFLGYVKYLMDFSQKQQAVENDFGNAKTAADTAAARKKAGELNRELMAYRENYAKKYPNTLLSNIFMGMKLPEVPQGTHYMPDGKTVDSGFAYRYYKEHYWDGFNFADDRLMNTPIYDARLDEYFKKLVYPAPDSVNYEADKILAQMTPEGDLYKYTLNWITQFAANSNVMGMDEVFVYIVENYHMKGKTSWMSAGLIEQYAKRAREIAPNVIGNVAPEIIMVDLKNKEHKLSDVKSKYTLVVFWSPECGTCLKEVPAIDSLYEKVLKKKGVTVYAVRTDGEVERWQKEIEKAGIQDWINVYDPEHRSNYKNMYDVFGTPRVYLLDENKIIRGKRLGADNIVPLIEWLENEQTAKKS